MVYKTLRKNFEINFFGLREGFFEKITIFNKGWRKQIGVGKYESEVRFQKF